MKTARFSNSTKPCFVLLKRLDKGILDRYLRTEEKSLETSVSPKSTGKKHKKRGKHRLVKLCPKNDRDRKEFRERSESARESALTYDFLRRKRKFRTKPLQYTDDEEEVGSASPTESVSEKTRGDRLALPVKESPNSQKSSGSEIGTSHDGTPTRNQKNPAGSKKSSGAERNDFRMGRGFHDGTPTRNQKNPAGSKKSRWGRKKQRLILENILEHSPHKTAYAERQLKSDIQPSEVLLQRNKHDLAGKMDCVAKGRTNDCDAHGVENEVEMIGEYQGIGGCKTKVNCDNEGEGSSKFEDEEYDSRDESEDDKATVVFEKSLSDSATDLEEVFEKAEKKTRSVKKKFQKKKIMNRKKRTLVKFKRRRSMMGRNSAKVKKLRNKCSQMGDTEKESVGERNMKEVCGMVKHLHELYRIILQLQKDLSMNAEQADYFKKVINVEQENFYKELRKSQKTIIRGYVRMLSSFGNPSTVSEEIGRRTSLSKEDIANVISRCTSNLGGWEEKKRVAGTGEKEPNYSRESSPKTFGVGDFSRELRRLVNEKIDALISAETVEETARVEKLTKEDFCNTPRQLGTSPAMCSQNREGSADADATSRLQLLHPSGNQGPPKPFQRPSNEPNMPKEVATRENHTATYFPHPPADPSFRVSLPLRNDFQDQWPDHSNLRPHFCPQKNSTHRTHVVSRDPKLRQFFQHDPSDVRGNQVWPLSRPAHNQSSNFIPQCSGDDHPVHCGGTPAVSYSSNNSTVDCFQIPGGFAPAPPVAETGPRLLMSSPMNIGPHPLEYSQGRSPAHYFPQVPNPCSLAPAVRSVPLLPHFDRPWHGNTQTSWTNRSQKNSSCSTNSPNNFRRPDSGPLSKSSECSASGEEEQCFLGTLFANPDLFSPPETQTQTSAVTAPLLQPGQMYGLPTDPTNESVPGESYALDPTIPQKLTMRNCRLEAGPILRLESESWKPGGGEDSGQWQESSADASETEALNQEGSRVYLCAQNGCKNLGVRICKGCVSIIYCSETCQLKHWTLKHKTECHQLKELRIRDIKCEKRFRHCY